MLSAKQLLFILTLIPTNEISLFRAIMSQRSRCYNASFFFACMASAAFLACALRAVLLIVFARANPPNLPSAIAALFLLI